MCRTEANWGANVTQGGEIGGGERGGSYDHMNAFHWEMKTSFAPLGVGCQNVSFTLFSVSFTRMSACLPSYYLNKETSRGWGYLVAQFEMPRPS